MRTRRIAGRYELLEQLGGSTWRAADTELQRDVLVQVPARDVAVARLTHPGIVQVFDQGEEDGEPYAVFEYLPGGSLEQRLEAGSLTEGEVEQVAADVSSALAYAHAEGVTHGSLGPAAVLLDGEGRAKVAGFTGGATPEDDERALAALLQTLGAAATTAGDDVTVVLPPPRLFRRRPACGREPAPPARADRPGGARSSGRRRRSRARRRLGGLEAGERDGLRLAADVERLDDRPGGRTACDDLGRDDDGDADHRAGDDGAPGDDELPPRRATTAPPATTDAASGDDRAAAHDGAAAGHDRAAADHGAAAPRRRRR